MNATTRKKLTDRRLTTPHSAAISGVISGILFIIIEVIQIAFSQYPTGNPAFWEENLDVLILTVNLVPFAGIFFLWFIGVNRDRLGDLEDKFFATIFLGSGLLYLATTFIANAMSFGMISTYGQDSTFSTSQVYSFTRTAVYQITYVYASRMSAVFMISSATMWMSTRVMPIWLAILTYLLAFVLLLVVSINPWLVLVFPVWMVVVSIFILIANYRCQSVDQAALSGA